MDDDIRDIYEADCNRRRDDSAQSQESVEDVVSAVGGGILYVSKQSDPWEGAYPPEPKTPMDAYADGWMAYCESEDESPYRQLDLRSAWEDGWADAEDFYGGEPCH